MILLTATLDAHGGFTFMIEVSGTIRLVSDDPGHVAKVLGEMGVSEAEALIKHAKAWGSVEIATE